ncbi:MAG: hypothetical protein Q9219_004425 [cf. Caloplaca sp. 3 TL-2023]
MGEERKTYFLAPTRDSPPSGPIALGSIIASPKLAELPITSPLPIDPSVMSVARHEDRKWKLMLEKHRGGSIGLWGSFLQVLGTGGDIGFSREVSDIRTFEFDRLETQSFWPTEEYVKASVMAQPVQDFFKNKRFFHNVYMITSLKIAFGASIARSVLQDRGLYVHLGVDATSMGLPLSGGPEGEVGWGSSKSSSSERDSGFVFAFRLREICYTTRRGIRQSQYVKGALFGHGMSKALGENTWSQDTPSDRTDNEGEVSEEFELMGLADEDVHADDIDGVAQDIEEDGEICECVPLSG